LASAAVIAWSVAATVVAGQDFTEVLA